MSHTSDDQQLCWSCEESVHSSALYCPYCNADLKKHAPLRPKPPTTPKLPHPPPTQPTKPSHLRFILATLLASIGTTLLFLSALITCFSKDGSFILSWQERQWTSYLGLGIALIALSVYALHTTSSTREAL